MAWRTGLLQRLESVLSRIRTHSRAFLVSILVAVVYSRTWIFSSALPAGPDALQYASGMAILSRNFALFYIWQSDGIGGQYLIGFQNFISIANLAIQDPIATEKILFFLFIALASISAYFLSLRLWQSQGAAIASSLIYAGSQLFERLLSTGTLNLVFAFSIAPLSMLFLYNSAKTGSLRWILLYSTTAVLTIIARPDFLFYWIPIHGIFLVGAVFASEHTSNVERLLRVLRVLSLSLLSVVLFTAFEWLPLLTGSVPQYLQIRSAPQPLRGPDIVSAILNLPQPAGNMAAYIGSHPVLTFLSMPDQAYLLLSAIAPILAFTAVVVQRTRLSISLTVATTVNLFLAKGPQEPLGSVNQWLFTRVWPMTLLYDANRWLMPVTLGYALLASLTVKRILAIRGGAGISPNEVKREEIHTPLGNARKQRHVALAIGILSLIILATVSSAPVPWVSGLCTVRPDPSFLTGFKWLANQSDRGLVFPIPYGNAFSNGPWFGSSCGGWQNDLGFVSPLWSKKPVLYPGDYTDQTRYTTQFFSHYIGSLILTKGTQNLGKILGPLGVGYIVANSYPAVELPPWSLGRAPPGYALTYQQDFISNQIGILPVFASNDSTVYVNPYWKPQIYASGDPIYVVGGAEALSYLASLSPDLSSHPFLFVDQVPQNFVDSAQPSSVFVNSEVVDLAMLLTKPSVRLDFSSSNLQGFEPVNDPLLVSPYSLGGYELSGSVFLQTKTTALARTEFSVDKDGIYEFWMRGIFAGEGSMYTLIDDSIANSTILMDHTWSAPHWIRLASAALKAGQHSISFGTNAGTTNSLYVSFERAGLYAENIVDTASSYWASRLAQGMESDFIIGTSRLFGLMSGPDPLLFQEEPYLSVGGISLFSAWGANGSIDLSGLPPGSYELLAHALPGATNATIEVSSTSGNTTAYVTSKSGYLDDSELQSTYWTNLNPGYVSLQDAVPAQGPPNELEISIASNRTYYSLIQKDFSPAKDWSGGRYFSLVMKGSTTGDVAQIFFYFDASHDSYAEYNLPISDQWTAYSLDKLKPDGQQGVIDWANVTRFRIATAEKTLNETLYLYPSLVSYGGTTSDKFGWITLGQVGLDQKTLNFRISGQLSIDQLVLLQGTKDSSKLMDSNAVEPIEFRRDGRNSFTVTVNASQSFSLVFEQSYDDRWIASVPGASVLPLLSNRFMMSYLLPEGHYEVQLHFEGDTVQWIGYGTSLAAFSVLGLASVGKLNPILQRAKKLAGKKWAKST